ncbi:hypothetical protein KRX51_08810 [Corynebacterium sp. TAE3-ERU12]|uniref:hypothetical protein n=1 Tax=Corynebacterium sp. TAE3-ERU12 TaxID=2849491 RepID=UPI001C472C6E|nr:hypothetical protein [Corynebacterium sp. TAE3-ERU12]MBV7296009.1 hypothetical protein [Corynebacterium sp. TAE3-ERU12]
MTQSSYLQLDLAALLGFADRLADAAADIADTGRAVGSIGGLPVSQVRAAAADLANQWAADLAAKAESEAALAEATSAYAIALARADDELGGTLAQVVTWD